MTAPAILVQPEELSSRPATNILTRTYTLKLTDALVILVTQNAESVTIALPPESSVAWEAGTLIQIIQGGAGSVTIDPGTGVTLHEPNDNYTMSAQNAWMYLKRTAANTWYMTKFGDGSMGATVFTALTDTPSNYTSAGLKLLQVNSGATAVQFSTVNEALAPGVNGMAHLGIGTSDADANKPLYVIGPVVRFHAVEAADGGSGDCTLVLNKETASDTGSILFQTGQSDRARVGLIGSDSYRVRVSPDGSTYYTSIAANHADGSIDLTEAETEVASAATANIGAANTLKILISGTTTITSLGTSANKLRFIRFSGALTLTHNATSLILPGSANILTVAGDTCLALSDASGNWRVYLYSRGAEPASYAASRNFLGNASFDVWQRGTSFALSSGAYTKAADLWHAYRNATNGTVSRQTGFSGAQYCVRIEKVGGTATQSINIYHQIESAVASQLAGKTVTVSYDARASSSYNGAGLALNLYTGTGTDETFTPSAFPTGADGVAAADQVITTTATRYSATLVVPATCNEMVMRLGAKHTGDSNHYVEITNVKLEIGPAATRYEPEPLAVVMERCERRFQKTFLQATAPAQNAGAGTGEYRATATIAGANVNRLGTYVFSTPMRTAPTATTYNPAAASAEARDITNSVNCTSTTVENITEKSCGVIATGNAATTVGAQIGLHMVLDAEFA